MDSRKVGHAARSFRAQYSHAGTVPVRERQNATAQQLHTTPAHVQDGDDGELLSSTVQQCQTHHPQPILLHVVGSGSCCSTRVQQQQQRRRRRVHDCFCFKRLAMARGRHCPELPVRGGASSCGGCAWRVLRHKGACLLCLHSDNPCESVCCCCRAVLLVVLKIKTCKFAKIDQQQGFLDASGLWLGEENNIAPLDLQQCFHPGLGL